MKKIFTLLVLTLICLTNIYAQNCAVDTTYSYNLKGNAYQKEPFARILYTRNTNNEIIQFIRQLWVLNKNSYRNDYKIDYVYSNSFPSKSISETSYDFDTLGNVWVGYTKIEKTYDNNGNTINNTNNFWDKPSNTWKKSREDNSNYNVSNKITDITIKEFVPHLNSLRNKYYYSYIYDGNGNKTISDYNNWDTVTNSFKIYSIVAKTYSASNKLLSETFQYWDEATSSLKYTNSYVYTYTSSDLLEFFTSYSWDAVGNVWKPTTRGQSVYSSQDLLIAQYADYWETVSGTWAASSKSETSYNSFLEPDITTSYVYNNTFFSWDKSRRVTYNYNPNAMNTQRKYEDWIASSNEWKTTDIYNFDYNTGDSLIYEDYYLYNSSTNSLIKESYTTLNYKNYNPIFVKESYYGYSTLQGYFLNASREEHLCKLANTNISTVNISNFIIYPNPVKDGAINFKTIQNTPYQIYNLEGKMIQSGIIEPLKNIDVKLLKPGFYIIKTDSYSSKFIVE